MKLKLIAPCGMNCGICSGYLREKNKCHGCRGRGPGKPEYCKTCKMVTCDKAKGKYCFSCDSYPCTRLKQLDKRYRTKYNMSMLENLENIRKLGIRKFVRNEKKRWACKCGGVINVHKGVCFECGK